MSKCKKVRKSHKKMRWVDNALVFSPVYIGLCVSEDVYRRELRRLRVETWRTEVFLSSSDQARCTILETPDGKRCALVSILPSKKRTLEQTYALLVHEAVHVWQEVKLSIGEDKPSAEFEAYGVQAISLNLMCAYSSCT